MLDGIRVVDFSQYLPGPYASMRLADRGAEVVKVESLNGDPARVMADQKDGTGLIFLANNRNKKSVALNLKEDEGRQIALDLVANADVIIESFRPGVMARLGLSYEEVKKVNPMIIYCSLSGYGQDSSISHLGSHDLNYMALSGLLSQLKTSDGTPVQPSMTFADLIGGIAASEAILGALVQRGRKGIGQYIDLAIADVMVSFMANHAAIASETGHKYGLSELAGELVCYNIYQTQDDRYITLGALEPKFWQNFCKAVEKEQWIEGHYSKAEESNTLYKEVKDLFFSRTFAEWHEFSMQVDCCLMPVFETNELKKLQYINERELIKDDQSGTTYVATNTSLSQTLMTPGLGQHTEELLGQLLKKNKKEVARLKEKKIIPDQTVNVQR
ncbi:CaiB/BaiF CoA transferase family protein [Anaerobacillus sp. MEB173]|uniref:CaiB/BaiF CoA transferase family protein n=1 Tax=Anaerobacillus sp. MEB173 TaxID=3383345 RepID=UPI003F93C29E